MATVAVSLGSVCAGGDHISLSVSLNGGAAQIYRVTDNDIRSGITADERLAALLVILRLRMQGLTRAQARSDLEAGFTVTI